MNIDTLKYFNKANEYWTEKGYDKADNCAVINYKDKCWCWIRESKDDSSHVHISRFVSDEKKKGLGSKMVYILKDGYTSISAWVKPELFSFYTKHDFVVQDDSMDEYGYYYLTFDKLHR